MVTVAEAKTQLQTQRTTLESQRQQIQQRTQQAKLTTAQVRAQTRQGLVQRDLEKRRLGALRQEALQTLDPVERELKRFESEIQSVEKEIQQAEKQRSDFEQAKKLFQTGVVDPAASPSVRKLIREFEAGKEAVLESQIKEQIQTLEEKGLTPIFIDGELRGFEDTLAKQSRTLEQIEPIVIGGSLVGVSDIRFQLTRPLKVPVGVEIALPEIPPGVVRPAETNIEQLVRNIKESVPELRFVKNEDLRKALQTTILSTGIAPLIGTEEFLKSKLKKTLADPTGVFKFRPDQAEPIAELIFNVAEGFVAGAVVGKVVTLIRGAGARFLPAALTSSTKFTRVTSALGTAGVITLTGAAGISIAKTFSEEGQDAAILETIGLISFGAGFTATGLRSLPQAQKEFTQVANILKKAVPSGKRGEARFDELGRFLKKKEGGRFGELAQLDKSEVQEAERALAAIEKRLARTRDTKEQLKILAEIKKKLKTTQAKENFETFVLGLIEKDILKLPKIEVLPKIGVKPTKPITVTVPKAQAQTPARLREIQRVSKNKTRNQKRIERSKLTLGQKYKQAQRVATALTIATAPRLTSAQRIVASQKQRQKLLQKQKTQQRTRQRSRQKLLLRQRTTSRTALRQLLRQSFRTGQKLKPLIKPKIPLFPKIPIPKKKKKKPLEEIIPIKIKAKSFDVRIRRKGKFITIDKSLPKNRATRKLLRNLDTTLAASGRLVPSNNPPKKKDIQRVNIKADSFRLPVKKSPLRKPGVFTIIERRNKRLNTRSEVIDIQRSRKIKLKSTPMIK
ncbi:hypothetical protein LCGC14_0476530 [marine sediment metagenome]|uniref:Uncharacterized protein n=1 Tax=marine sediment metagenome TaxID=412755 RepID=A0A0F9SAM7_9ZZZZ